VVSGVLGGAQGEDEADFESTQDPATAHERAVYEVLHTGGCGPCPSLPSEVMVQCYKGVAAQPPVRVLSGV
jgi:hypothetical protein